MDQSCFDIIHLPKDSRTATKYVVEMLLKNIYPLLHRIWNKLHYKDDNKSNDENILVKFQDVYSLCSSQIKKCILNLLEVFKQEHQTKLYLQESRQYILERLICCFEKLYSIEERLEESDNIINNSLSDDSLLFKTMYFVNWIDQTFEILSKLSSLVYTTDCKKSEELYNEWKIDVVNCISGLHKSVDELLLSAMTLCRYCLSSDQLVVKVRCQVVLRETKALIGDLIEGDLDGVFHVTKESLKLPVMPSNINLLIDVLKDVLYVLETNTNTALLALLVYCFSYSTSPVEALRNHLKSKYDGMCPCKVKYDDVAESCLFVKDFDLYNERLLQIGSFAISCSSDEKRVLSLKSGLASLEALDPHLVPALMLSPDSTHSALLVDSWNQEILEIKNNVFLIVDPTAFSEKAKQMMHQVLLDINKDKCYNNTNVCSVINIGCTVYEFFNTYNMCEPEALEQSEEILPLLNDLNKAQLECKVVSNMLCSGNDIVYNIKKSKSPKEVSFGQLQKRLKLLYTLVTRINALVSPKENDPHFSTDDLGVESRNLTKTLYGNGVTCVNSPRRQNVSRSIFTRTMNIRSSTAKLPLGMLTKNLKVTQYKDLSFSLKLDEMCVLSPNKSKHTTSILYHSPMKTRSSLRKAVLNRQCMTLYKNQDVKCATENDWERTGISEKGSLIDGSTSLQITEVLNQINELAKISRAPRVYNMNSTISINPDVQEINHPQDEEKHSNILRLNINNDNTSNFKQVWNISVKSSDSVNGITSFASNVTQPSNVTTLERINDLEFVENKLSALLTLEMETSL